MEAEFRKSPENLAVLVVGTDTIIEALPARPLQLANACGVLGFDLVVPLSWGDELVAEAAIRALESSAASQAVFCACPLVRQRLLGAGTDLASVMVSITPSPAAVARHLRSMLGDRLGSLTFAGRCPGATLPDFDAVYDPRSLLDILNARGIRVELEPDTFVDRLPPDRRRSVSLPGGCPAPEPLWQRCNEMALVELDGSSDIAMEIAQHLLSGQSVLVDPAPAIGCFCCGVTVSTTAASARVATASLEPPRSLTPIITEAIPDGMNVPLNGVSPRGRPDDGRTESVRHRPPMAVTPASALTFRW